jgi:hypothetical protein
MDYEFDGVSDYATDDDVEMRDVSSLWSNAQIEEGGYHFQMFRNVETTTQGTQTNICGEIVPKGNEYSL